LFRMHCPALSIPEPRAVPLNVTTPIGELIFMLGLSVSTTVATQIEGFPITTTLGVQLTEVAVLLTSAAPSNGISWERYPW